MVILRGILCFLPILSQHTHHSDFLEFIPSFSCQVTSFPSCKTVHVAYPPGNFLDSSHPRHILSGFYFHFLRTDLSFTGSCNICAKQMLGNLLDSWDLIVDKIKISFIQRAYIVINMLMNSVTLMRPCCPNLLPVVSLGVAMKGCAFRWVFKPGSSTMAQLLNKSSPCKHQNPLRALFPVLGTPLLIRLLACGLAKQ